MRIDRINLALKKIMGDSTKKILVKVLFPFRNRFILFNVTNHSKKNRINLNYWHEDNNLGDTLSPVVVNYLISLKGLTAEQPVRGTKHLYAIGSIITAGIQDATIWGSGILNSKLLYRLEKRTLDVRAVRGPLSKAVLLDYGYNVQDVFGDPAILMPEIYNPIETKISHKFGLIVHKDYDISKVVNDKKVLNEVKKIEICTDNYKDFINHILSVEIVISSSLHGIILAEAYGVKAVLLKPQIDFFKYYDYYFSTKRFNFPMAESLESALEIKPIELPNNLGELRIGLKNAFPFDLFSINY